MFGNYMMKCVVFLCCVFCMPQEAMAERGKYVEDFSLYRQEELDMKGLFGSLTGTAVILKPGTQQILVYNAPLAEQRFSPFSTFKIISAMFGLEYGVVKDAQSKMRYNGIKYWHAAWNKDVTFKEAFQHSCVWYFRQLIDKVPEKYVQKYLQELRYGNADVSSWRGNGSDPLAELNGFWLNSSLQISPLEQAKALHNLFYLASPYPAHDKKLVEDFMQVGHGSIHGKTGSDGKGQSWFVGFIKKGLYKDYFAFYVRDANDSAPHAKNVALKFFGE